MHKVTYIKGQTVECVQSYKYLGTIFDSKLCHVMIMKVSCQSYAHPFK